jgi:hypothetical protein
MFVGLTKLSDQNFYELDFEPRCVQTNDVYPGNKMHWKFFELPKFKQSKDFQNITKDSMIKHQWLEFLLECQEQKTEPDRHELIKKGYTIMDVAKWNADDQALYWRMQSRINDLLEEEQQNQLKAEEKGKLEGLKEGKLAGLKEGEVIGKVKSDIRTIKHLKRDERDEKVQYPEEKFTKKLKLLKDKFTEVNDYFNDHEEVLNSSDNEEQIMGDIGINPSNYID